MSVAIEESQLVVRGECVQLLSPAEVDEYAVGEIGELFASHGWTVAVISEQPQDPPLRDKLTNYVRRLSIFGKADYVTDLLVLNPEFREGDTVRLACVPLDGHWYCHPINPLYPKEVLR